MAFVPHYYIGFGTPFSHDIAKRIATVYDIQSNVGNSFPKCGTGKQNRSRSQQT